MCVGKQVVDVGEVGGKRGTVAGQSCWDQGVWASLGGGCGILVLRRKIRSCDLRGLIGLPGLSVMALFCGDVFTREGWKEREVCG